MTTIVSTSSSDVVITVFRMILGRNGIVSTWVVFLEKLKLFIQNVSYCFHFVSILQEQIFVSAEVGHQAVVNQLFTTKEVNLTFNLFLATLAQ